MVRIQSIWLCPFSRGTFPGLCDFPACASQRSHCERCSASRYLKPLKGWHVRVTLAWS